MIVCCMMIVCVFCLCLVLHLSVVYLILIFFFKQKTAYEMRISDWSSDVCSSDLLTVFAEYPRTVQTQIKSSARREAMSLLCDEFEEEIGRASCRERVCQYV